MTSIIDVTTPKESKSSILAKTIVVKGTINFANTSAKIDHFTADKIFIFSIFLLPF